MPDVKFLIFKILEIVFGVIILGIAAGAFNSRNDSIGYIIFSGILLAVVGLVLLIMELIGKSMEMLVSLIELLFVQISFEIIDLYV